MMIECRADNRLSVLSFLFALMPVTHAAGIQRKGTSTAEADFGRFINARISFLCDSCHRQS